MGELALVDPGDAPKPRRKRHSLIEAGASGDRLAILEASLAYTLETLADPECPAYVRGGLLRTVNALSAAADEIRAERARVAEEAYGDDDGAAEAWDASAI